jgi:hypothetical protein
MSCGTQSVNVSVRRDASDFRWFGLGDRQANDSMLDKVSDADY